MTSKAQGLSLNTIIIAALVLLVLLILVGLTSGFFGKWVPKFNLASATSCAEIGGKVVSKDSVCLGYTKEGKGFYGDVGENQKCCAPMSCGEVKGTCKSECDSTYEYEAYGVTGCGTGKKCCKPSEDF